MYADSLAIGEIWIFPGALRFEPGVVSQQAVAGRNVECIPIQGYPAQTAPALFAEPLDVREVVPDGVKNRLACEIDEIGAAVEFTLGGAVYGRRSQ